MKIFFIQVVCVPAYIATIISAAADEGPGEMTCFPSGLHYLLTFPIRMSKNNTEIGVSLCELFAEKGCLDLSDDISPYMRTFSKGIIYG